MTLRPSPFLVISVAVVAALSEPTSANYTSSGGLFGSVGWALTQSTEPSGRFLGSGTAAGHSGAGGFSGADVALGNNSGALFDAGDTRTDPYAIDIDAVGYAGLEEFFAGSDPNTFASSPGSTLVPRLGYPRIALLWLSLLASEPVALSGQRLGRTVATGLSLTSLGLAQAPESSAIVSGQALYQDLLLDPMGSPSNGLENFEVRIYDSLTSGNLLRSETHNDIDALEGDDSAWEREPLDRLVHEGQLSAYSQEGFWRPMGTLTNKNLLEDIWRDGSVPWKVW